MHISIMGPNFEMPATLAARKQAFMDANPDARMRDALRYLQDNYADEYKLGFRPDNFWDLDEIQEMIEFSVNIGMHGFNPSFTNGYRNAPNILAGSNNLVIGIGSRISLPHGFSFMFGSERPYPLFQGRNFTPQENAYRGVNENHRREANAIAAFANRLRHYANGNVPERFIMADDNAANHLRAMGIDPSQEFTVNGVRMRYADGQVHRV